MEYNNTVLWGFSLLQDKWSIFNLFWTRGFLHSPPSSTDRSLGLSQLKNRMLKVANDKTNYPTDAAGCEGTLKSYLAK